jgi:hypothetical protein
MRAFTKSIDTFYVCALSGQLCELWQTVRKGQEVRVVSRLRYVLDYYIRKCDHIVVTLADIIMINDNVNDTLLYSHHTPYMPPRLLCNLA